ncbi:MAG: hemerythrin domain-containing protein [Candidatus Omnitrophica bacterium]|nr:hemerythrin domain-containing protein [Candidatus Omnitrophota bacterium]
MKITEYLSCQHHVFLEQLLFLEELKASQALDQVTGLKEMVFIIADAVEKHGELEEQYLFRELEPHLGKEMGPLAVMEFEHGEIRKILGALREAQDIHTIRLETAKFIVFLRDHIAKEEKVLFPMAEDLVSGARLDAVGKAAAMQDRMRKMLV